VALVREKKRGGYYDLALITTDRTSTPTQIVQGYARRWPIEVVFRQAREVLGVGQAHNRTARAVQRTVPFGLCTYTMIILWYARHGDPAGDVTTHRTGAPWYTTKTKVSFHDMFQALRRSSSPHNFHQVAPNSQPRQKSGPSRPPGLKQHEPTNQDHATTESRVSFWTDKTISVQVKGVRKSGYMCTH
jgi:hypothetical protein